MLQILIGTVGFAILLAAVGAWALTAAAKALEEFDDEADVLAGGPSGSVADYRLGWQDQRAVCEVQSDLQGRLADRRREAAEVAVFRAIKGGADRPAARQGAAIQGPPAA